LKQKRNAVNFRLGGYFKANSRKAGAGSVPQGGLEVILHVLDRVEAKERRNLSLEGLL